MKLVSFVVVLLMMTSVSLAKERGKRGKNSSPVHTINKFKAQGRTISFTCRPTNCREQEDGTFLFNLGCQTDKEGDKLEVSMGDKSQTIQAYGFVDIAGDIKAPKRGSVPIKMTVSEMGESSQTTFTWKYTVAQIQRPTCRKYGDIEL